MKILIKRFVLTFLLASFICCKSEIKVDLEKVPVQKNYFIKSILRKSVSYNPLNKKDSVCMFYNEKGEVDSSVFYTVGMLNGSKIIYTANGIIKYKFTNDSLMRLEAFDSLGVPSQQHIGPYRTVR